MIIPWGVWQESKLAVFAVSRDARYLARGLRMAALEPLPDLILFVGQLIISTVSISKHGSSSCRLPELSCYAIVYQAIREYWTGLGGSTLWTANRKEIPLRPT